MPLEYTLIGVSMNFSSSEKAMISSIARVDLGVRHSEDRGVEFDVLPAGEFRMESAPSQQRRQPAVDLHLAAGRYVDSAITFSAVDLPAPLPGR